MVFGIGLLHQEVIVYAEELGILALSESKPKYSGTGLLLGYHAMARHFSKIYGRKIEDMPVMSRKCNMALVLFDNY